MKDRLMELLWCASRDYSEFTNCMHEEGLSVTESYEEYAADYLLANGMIAPRYKVGYIVWVIDRFYKFTKPEIESRKILSVQVYKNGDIQYHYKDGCFYEWHIGKTVFLTKEEAEVALKGGVQNG